MNENIRLISRAVKKNKRLLVEVEDKIYLLKTIVNECENDLKMMTITGQKAY